MSTTLRLWLILVLTGLSRAASPVALGPALQIRLQPAQGKPEAGQGPLCNQLVEARQRGLDDTLVWEHSRPDLPHRCAYLLGFFVSQRLVAQASLQQMASWPRDRACSEVEADLPQTGAE